MSSTHLGWGNSPEHSQGEGVEVILVHDVTRNTGQTSSYKLLDWYYIPAGEVQVTAFYAMSQLQNNNTPTRSYRQQFS